MRKIILIKVIFLFFAFLFWLWQGGGKEVHIQLRELSEDSNQFLAEIQNQNYPVAAELLLKIKEQVNEIPTYLFTRKGSWEELDRLIYAAEATLFLSKPNLDVMWPQALSLYYALDSLTHPHQPLWLQSLQNLSSDWGDGNYSEILQRYLLIRPAITMAMDQDKLVQFDRMFSDYTVLSKNQVDALIYDVKDHLEEKKRRSSIYIIWIIGLHIIIVLGYVAWKKREANKVLS